MTATLIEQLFLFIFLIHHYADFALQTHDQAIGKGTSHKWLSYHVGVYSLVWLFASYIWFMDIEKAFIFASITFVCHYITDFTTSRIGKPFWKDGKDLHNGFTLVGADQIFHYLQLYYTFKFLILL